MIKFFKIIQILYEYLIDILLLLIFNRYSFLANKRNRLNYNILINAHSIEKGLSLEKPKHLFGKKKIAPYQQKKKNFKKFRNFLIL